MATLEHDLNGIIEAALPNLAEETKLKVIDRLLSCGLSTIEELKYVQQEDIKDILPVIQQRKLMEVFKNGMPYLFSLT